MANLNNLPPVIEVDGKLRPTANSQGDPIASDQNSVRQFWRWFNDSVTVDEHGRPILFHHGSNAQFETFDFSKIKSINEGLGFYFTDNPTVAQGYGQIKSGYLAIRNPMNYAQQPLTTAQIKKLLHTVAKLEAQADEIDIADGFLSNFAVDIRSEGLNAALLTATKIMAKNADANDLIASLFNHRVCPEIILTAARQVTGFDAIMANGFDNCGKGDNQICVAWSPDQFQVAQDRSNHRQHDVDNSPERERQRE